MILKAIVDEDLTNYKYPSMLLAFPNCTFKCEKDSGIEMCQNKSLTLSNNIEMDIDLIITRYLNNSLTSAIVCAGLEPFDSFDDLHTFIDHLRKVSNDDVAIYTGYYKNEIQDQIDLLKRYPNIIVKFSRYIPNQSPHYDKILGVELASDNQYAEKIS